MNGRLTFAATGAVLSLVTVMTPAKGALVTWQFAGEITSVVDRNNLLDGAITVGTPFSGSYTFESTTPDLDPKNTGNGRYDDAITSVSGIIGDLTFGGPIQGDNLIAVRDDFFVGGVR